MKIFILSPNYDTLFSSNLKVQLKKAGTVVVQIRKKVHGQHKEDEDKINGLIHSVFVMFHPYQEKKMEGVSKFKAMALAITSFADYVIREKITARLPYNRLDINHIP